MLILTVSLKILTGGVKSDESDGEHAGVGCSDGGSNTDRVGA